MASSAQPNAGNTDNDNDNSPQPKRSPRVRYDNPTADPQQSVHWQSLPHLPGDQLVHTLEDLIAAFQADLAAASSANVVPTWSTVCGYCEALTTHKDPLKRYRPFPVPLDALRRLVHDEFIPFCQQLQEELQSVQSVQSVQAKATSAATKHREAVRKVSNAVWKKAHGKSKDARDEVHANSLYVCFRGSIDKRSLDCFGAALITVAVLQYILKTGDDNDDVGDDNGKDSNCSTKSFLTLSEDHAYESHCLSKNLSDIISDKGNISMEQLGTCEIAIPGNTKEVQQTRGLDVAEALLKANKNKRLPYQATPETSWLYMRRHAVVCLDRPMMLAALVGNINCSIVTKNTNNNATSVTNLEYFASAPLMDLKRDLLWALYDHHDSVTTFPFALMELAECEDHRTTTRGLDWVDVTDMGIPDKVLGVEKLYLQAMSVSRNLYGDAQTYPYFCAAHYHKDSVWEELNHCSSNSNSQHPSTTTITVSTDKSISVCAFNPDQEYRLVEAVRLYSEAARVASQYVYELQLMKQTTMAAMLIMNDILLAPQQQPQQEKQQQQQPRTWRSETNAVATGTWLIAFLDSLLLWEERCGGKPFCEVLQASHKYSIGKLFQQFAWDIRKQILDRLYPPQQPPSAAASCEAETSAKSPGEAITETNIRFFSHPRSRRLALGSSLLVALLAKEKVVVHEMQLVIDMSGDDGRRAKRARKSAR